MSNNQTTPLLAPAMKYDARSIGLYLLFFTSGIPALFYQLIWQRSLFAIYGISIEAISMVVAAFMLGLGLGSLFGGWLSVKAKNKLLILFGVGELLIGIFGYFSLLIFNWVGDFTLHSSVGQIFFITFLLVCIPTLIMGATLPLLVAHNTRNRTTVGYNAGTLYFVNTLGSALACLLAAFWIMKVFEQTGVIKIAATINILIGLGACLLAVRETKADSVELRSETEIYKTNFTVKLPELSFGVVLILALATGFIALSSEIVWARVYAFASANLAPVYAMFLAFYLMGIAFGALLSRSFCNAKVLPVLWVTVLASSLLGYLLLPTLAWSQLHTSLISTLPWIAVITTLFGFALPLLSQSSIVSNTNTGKKISYIYLANILGATLGILITGLVVTDYFSISQISLLLAYLGLGTAILILCQLKLSIHQLSFRILIIAILAGLMAWSAPLLFNNFYEKLQYKANYNPNKKFTHLLENKAGIITVSADGTVYGNGAYDGIFNTNLINDPNLTVRAYAISAFHPLPTDVLMIGLSTGAWAQIIANNPQVKNLTIIEINPGYLKLIPQYPMVASLLKNPKVHIVIADGRRWLRQNPQQKFDLIVMNTTWNWREYASNVLSTDFLNRTRLALKPGGILYYNTTSSARVARTGFLTYPYAIRILNFLALSDTPIKLDKQRWEQVLKNYQIDGKKTFNLTNLADQQRLQAILILADPNHPGDAKHWYAVEGKDSFLQRFKTQRLVTDNNMGTEWM